jgi:hypothetical protein
MPRVAACSVCYKLERLTDPPADVPYIPATVKWDDHGVVREYTFKEEDGSVTMVPQYDPIMEDFVGRHGHNRPDSDMGYIKVFPVDQKTWDHLDVVTEIKRELTEQIPGFWEELDHYKTGALECYNDHGNPDSHNRCLDYHDDSKRIGPKAPPKFQAYLCDVCPYVQTYLVSEMRDKAGLYDPKTAAAAQGQRIRRN